MWAAYQRMMKARPVATNIATAAVVMLVGDTVAQAAEPRQRRIHASAVDQRSDVGTGDSRDPLLSNSLHKLEWFDVSRSAVMVSWSSLFFSPFFLFWFRAVDGFFSTSLRGSLVKTVVTAAVVTIPVNVGAITYSTVAEAAIRSVVPVTRVSGETDKNMSLPEKVRVPFDGDAVWLELQRRWDLDLYTLFRGSVMFWVPLNCLNFIFVPPHLRVWPSIFGSVCWNAFLSFTVHGEPPSDHGEETGEEYGEQIVA